MMSKDNDDLHENEVLSPEELVQNTKKTLKSYIKANALLGFAAGITAGVTMIAVPSVEDSDKKIVIGCSGAIAAAAALGCLAVSMKKMNDIIDNHDDSIKFQLVKEFLDAKSEEDRNNLIDKIVDDLHEAAMLNNKN